MKKIKRSQSGLTKLILCAVLVLFVFFPFFVMVSNITADDIQRIFTSASFIPSLKTSVKSALITTCLSVSLGLALAFSIQRTNIRFKSALSILLILPMLIPSISHGMGLIVLFGTNGVIRNLFDLSGSIYGFPGMIVGSLLYSYPVAFLMLNDALKYEDYSPYEAAHVLGIPKRNCIVSITLPYLWRPLMSAFFTVFTMVITDYGIPLMIGGKNTTLAVMMYQEVLGQLDFGKGAVIGILLLVPAIVTFLFNFIFKSNAKMGYVTKEYVIKKNVLRDLGAYAVCAAALICIFSLFGAFSVVAFTEKYPFNMTPTFDNLLKMFTLRGDKYLLNSVIIAVCTALIGVAVAFVSAYMTSRLPSKSSRLLHLLSITTLTIPGIVLGLSYSMTFSGTFIYGTMAILILANLMHFFASPYQMMHNSLSKMNENLENVGLTLGISRLHIVLDVIIPQCKTTIIEMGSYFFVNSMITISAVSFLANVSTKPISLMIGQFEAQNNYECAAVISLIILVANVIVKAAVYCVSAASEKNKRGTAAKRSKKEI